MPRRLPTWYAKLDFSQPEQEQAPQPVPPEPEQAPPSPDLMDGVWQPEEPESEEEESSEYNESLPPSESEEEEVPMPATMAEREQLGILNSWNTRRDEEIHRWRHDNLLLCQAQRHSLERHPIEERGRLLMEAERQELLRRNAVMQEEHDARMARQAERAAEARVRTEERRLHREAREAREEELARRRATPEARANREYRRMLANACRSRKDDEAGALRHRRRRLGLGFS
jgi:hypothetical protein